MPYPQQPVFDGLTPAQVSRAIPSMCVPAIDRQLQRHPRVNAGGGD
jgi:hypothetical protein